MREYPPFVVCFVLGGLAAVSYFPPKLPVTLFFLYMCICHGPPLEVSKCQFSSLEIRPLKYWLVASSILHKFLALSRCPLFELFGMRQRHSSSYCLSPAYPHNNPCCFLTSKSGNCSKGSFVPLPCLCELLLPREGRTWFLSINQVYKNVPFTQNQCPTSTSFQLLPGLTKTSKTLKNR